MSKKIQERVKKPKDGDHDDLCRPPLDSYIERNNPEGKVDSSKICSIIENTENDAMDEDRESESGESQEDSSPSLKKSQTAKQKVAIDENSGSRSVKSKRSPKNSNQLVHQGAEGKTNEGRTRKQRVSDFIEPQSLAATTVMPNQHFLQWGRLIVSVVIACIAVSYCMPSYSNDKHDPTVLDFNSIVSKLEPKFKGQPSKSLSVIRSALKAVSKPRLPSESIDTFEPSAPAIILLLAAKGAEELSRHLAHDLVNAVSPDHLNISGTDYVNCSTNSGKKQIDDLLRTLEDDSYGAVLVEDLDRIPGATALMFHSYWDHENAPKKRVVYVITVALGEDIPRDSQYKQWDEFARERLSRSWKDIDNDQMEPLLTRLTVGVAAIRPSQ